MKYSQAILIAVGGATLAVATTTEQPAQTLKFRQGLAAGRLERRANPPPRGACERAISLSAIVKVFMTFSMQHG